MATPKERRPKVAPALKLPNAGMVPKPTAPPLMVIAGATVTVRMLDGKQDEFPSEGKQLLWSDLRIGHELGHGSQAKVRLVQHRPTKAKYALKIIRVDRELNEKGLQMELGQVGHTVHPNVVQSTEAFFLANDGQVRILMEYMDQGTLKDLINDVGWIPEPQLSCIARQVISGLSFLHQHGVVHRDLKPSNLLLNKHGAVKISDFGVSTKLSAMRQAETLIGSTAYMSPERVSGSKYDWHSDVWGVGLTIAQCALGAFPLLPETDREDEDPFSSPPTAFELAALLANRWERLDYDNILEKLHRWRPQRSPQQISPELRTFIDSCMLRNPTERPSCEELLQFEFIKKHSFSEDDMRRWLREVKPEKKRAAEDLDEVEPQRQDSGSDPSPGSASVPHGPAYPAT